MLELLNVQYRVGKVLLTQNPVIWWLPWLSQGSHRYPWDIPEASPQWSVPNDKSSGQHTEHARLSSLKEHVTPTQNSFSTSTVFNSYHGLPPAAAAAVFIPVQIFNSFYKLLQLLPYSGFPYSFIAFPAFPSYLQCLLRSHIYYHKRAFQVLSHTHRSRSNLQPLHLDLSHSCRSRSKLWPHRSRYNPQPLDLDLSRGLRSTSNQWPLDLDLSNSERSRSNLWLLDLDLSHGHRSRSNPYPLDLDLSCSHRSNVWLLDLDLSCGCNSTSNPCPLDLDLSHGQRSRSNLRLLDLDLSHGHRSRSKLPLWYHSHHPQMPLTPTTLCPNLLSPTTPDLPSPDPSNTLSPPHPTTPRLTTPDPTPWPLPPQTPTPWAPSPWPSQPQTLATPWPYHPRPPPPRPPPPLTPYPLTSMNPRP